MVSQNKRPLVPLLVVLKVVFTECKLSVPLRKTRFPVDWRLLFEGRFANIGIPLNIVGFLLFGCFCVWNFFGFWVLGCLPHKSVNKTFNGNTGNTGLFISQRKAESYQQRIELSYNCKIASLGQRLVDPLKLAPDDQCENLL